MYIFVLSVAPSSAALPFQPFGQKEVWQSPAKKGCSTGECKECSLWLLGSPPSEIWSLAQIIQQAFCGSTSQRGGHTLLIIVKPQIPNLFSTSLWSHFNGAEEHMLFLLRISFSTGIRTAISSVFHHWNILTLGEKVSLFVHWTILVLQWIPKTSSWVLNWHPIIILFHGQGHLFVPLINISSGKFWHMGILSSEEKNNVSLLGRLEKKCPYIFQGSYKKRHFIVLSEMMVSN